MSNTNHRVVAKNTVFLYFRMILILGVNLYASRIILKMLGVENVGIYNAVGSIVTLMGFISSALSAASSRYLTFALGQGQRSEVERIFRVSSTLYYCFAIVVVVVAETVGLWVVETQLTIPPLRMSAARWCFHFSIVSFLLSFVAIPYNALTIAHERMNAFAYISIVDAGLRLGVLYLLPLLVSDRLVAYSSMLVCVQLLVCILNATYCFRHFSETNARWLFDRRLSQQLGSYAGWSVAGYAALVGCNQGLNVLLNHFFNPVVSAARMFALQIQSAVTQCYYNFQLAVRPQIVKNYASQDYDEMHQLVIKSGKYAFLLVLIVVAPVMTYTESLLQLWLASPPPYLVAFTRLTMLACLVGSLSQHTIMAIHATGDIKRFQIVEGLCLLSTLPLAYCACRFWQCSPVMVYAIYVSVEAFTQVVRIAIVYPRIGLAYSRFGREIFLPDFAALIAVASLIVLFAYLLPAHSAFVVVALSLLLALLSAVAVVAVALSRNERVMVCRLLAGMRKSSSRERCAQGTVHNVEPVAPRDVPTIETTEGDVLISVIIPAYNAAGVVENCLRSIYSQSLSADAYEVIVVNDGSTDSTAHILRSWGEAHDNFRFVSKANAGVSVARNVALELAHGRYVVFADADDAFWPESLPKLAVRLQQCDTDLVICRSHDGVAERYRWDHLFAPSAVLAPQHILQRGYIHGSAWGVAFRRDFLNACHLRFVPGLAFGEDSQFVLEAMSCAAGVEFFSLLLYKVIGVPCSVSRVFTTDRIVRQTQNVKSLFDYIATLPPSRKSEFVAYMHYSALGCLVFHVLQTPNRSFAQFCRLGYISLCRSLPRTTAFPFMRRKILLLRNFPRLYYFLAFIKSPKS